MSDTLDALLCNPDRASIKFCTDSHTFRYKGRVVPGLLRPLKRTMWPRYKYDVANDRTAHRFTRRDPSIHRPSDGRKRGSRVHTQIETLTNIGPHALKAERGGKRILDEYTRKLLLAMRIWKWRPVASEVVLYDDKVGIATKADLVCIDSENRTVLVETKTGYYASWDRACASMDGPLNGSLSDTPRNQSLIQLLFTKRMMEGYGTRVHRAYVVHIHPDGVTPYKIPARIERVGELLATHVSECLRKNRRR